LTNCLRLPNSIFDPDHDSASATNEAKTGAA
jgi:hypothetical protein